MSRKKITFFNFFFILSKNATKGSNFFKNLLTIVFKFPIISSKRTNMDFINKMKKREFIEMALKTLAAVLAGFLAIILMEGMIYSIELNALKTKGRTYTVHNMTTEYHKGTVAYCIKQSDDKYFVIYYNEGAEHEWGAVKNDYKTKEECTPKNLTVEKVVMHAPNAFKFSITWPHYIVMAVFMAGIGGFFTWKFITLNKSYMKIVDEFERTGTIEITNI